MSENCIFCKIIGKKIPAKIIRETEKSILFADIHPQAPVHLLAIPKIHIPSFAGLADPSIITDITILLQEGAREYNLEARGYRIVTNIGADGGQTVHHLHFHLLGGRQMKWPPG